MVRFFLFCLVPSVALAEPITLEEAVGLAEKSNGDIRLGTLAKARADAELLGSAAYPHNPVLATSAGPALGPDSKALDLQVSVSQTLVLSGRRTAEISAAEARSRAAGLRLEFVRSTALAGVRAAFFQALAAGERVELTRAFEAVAVDAHRAVSEREKVGAATQLELNVAIAGVGRARNDRLTAERDRLESLRVLAGLIGWPADEPLEITGMLPTPEAPKLTQAEYLELVRCRGDVRALQEELEAAAVDIARASATAIPDLGVVVSWEHSGIDRVDSVLLGVEVPIPLFQRNQADRALALARKAEAEVQREHQYREILLSASAAWQSESLARAAVLGFDQDALKTSLDNLRLAEESFRAGKMGILEFNLVRRDLLETRLAHLDAWVRWLEARTSIQMFQGMGR